MASSFPQPSSVFSVNSFNGNSLPKPPNLFLPSHYHSALRRPTKISSSSTQSEPDSSPPNPLDSSSAENAAAGDDKVDPVKLALAKARAYKDKIKQSKANPAQNPIQVGERRNDGDVDDVPVSVKLAMEEARECKTNGKEVMDGIENVAEKQNASGLQEAKVWDLRETCVEEMVEKKEKLTISSIDFLGLDFSDKKKSRGMPAGMVPTVDPFSVELIIGDPSRFEDASLLKAPKIEEDDGSELYKPKVSTWSKPMPIKEDDDSELYKPKVSTWGVFPRPSNISKTFGGGRVIRPGEELETAEAKAAKEARTKHLLAAYKNKMGLTIDAKTKSECQKALNDGDYLMDLGKLKEALPYYEKIMKALVFQSELHGLAALQWSICQDSLRRFRMVCRPNEAQAMYKKLQSHPNVQVSRKARHLMFGFQAMEMMKVTTSSSPKTTGFQMYFEAFVGDKANNFLTEENTEDLLRQALPYIMFLMSPIFIVLYIASRKLV